MTLYALVGLGPNNVEVPCLLYADRERAVRELTELLGEPEKKKRGLFWRAPNFDNIENADGDYEKNPATKHFFTKYYGGCGECWAFVLKAVEEGKPFVGFDLD